MNNPVKLTTTLGSRWRYRAGSKPFRYVTAAVLVSALAGGAVVAAPTVTAEVKEYFGLYTDEELRAAEQAASDRTEARTNLSTRIEGAAAVVTMTKQSMPDDMTIKSLVKELEGSLAAAKLEL